MEQKTRLELAALVAFTFLNVPAYAAETESGQVRSLLDVAQEVCAPEFTNVLQFDEGLRSSFSNQVGQKYPLVTAQQHLVFDKYVIGAFVSAVQLGDMAEYMGALTSGKPISDKMRSKSSALLDLVDCLRITEDEEKKLAEFVDVSVEAENLPDHVNVETLLMVQNNAECLRSLEAGRRILAVDARAVDVKDQVQFILEDTVGRCEEDF